MLEAAQLQRLRARAHVHTTKCLTPRVVIPLASFDEVNPRFICGKREDADLVALLASYDELVATSAACARTLRDAHEHYFEEIDFSKRQGY